MHDGLHEEAVELLTEGTRQDALLRITRNADRLALVGSDGDDRIEIFGRSRLEADAHLVDDDVPEDRVKLVGRAEHGSGDVRVLVGRDEMPDDPNPERRVRLDPVRERLRQRTGADDEHVAEVTAPSASRLEELPQKDPLGHGRRGLDDE